MPAHVANEDLQQAPDQGPRRPLKEEMRPGGCSRAPGPSTRRDLSPPLDFRECQLRDPWRNSDALRHDTEPRET